MRAWFWKHRAVMGYLFLLAVVLLALEFHHNDTTGELNERDRISCEQRQRLATDQKLILSVLVPLTHAELREHDDIPEPERSAIASKLEALVTAANMAGPGPCE